jgi:hypothetical protein
MTKLFLGLMVSTLSMGVIPAGAHANDVIPLGANCPQPALVYYPAAVYQQVPVCGTPQVCPPLMLVSDVCPPVMNSPLGLPPAPPGYAWIFEQKQVIVRENVTKTVIVNGQRRNVTEVVQRVQTQTVPRLVQQTQAVAEPPKDLAKQLQELQDALGIGNFKDDVTSRENLSRIQKRVVVTLTATAPLNPADTNFAILKVSSAASLRVTQLYHVGTEIVLVKTVDTATNTVNVERAQSGTSAVVLLSGTAITPVITAVTPVNMP